MKDTYVYPAVFYDDPDGIAIEFPDLPGCLPCAHSMEEAFKNAKEALQLHLYSMEEDGRNIPEPSRVSDVKPDDSNGSIVMIEAWMPPFREKMLNKSTTKTVTIPRWLDILARKEKVNYSHLLQGALKNYLGVSESSAQHFQAQ
jgi:predicted RNase H-like HicB family nuclease